MEARKCRSLPHGFSLQQLEIHLSRLSCEAPLCSQVTIDEAIERIILSSEMLWRRITAIVH